MGTLTGLVAGFTALLAGHSVWMALALYAGGGTTVTLLVAGALVLPCPRSVVGRMDVAGTRSAKEGKMLPAAPDDGAP